MQLIYLYIQNYKNIQSEGFNFSPKYTCGFDNDTLTIEENKDYVDILPENIKLTALVGKNGSGKSSVLEVLKYGVNDYFIKLPEMYFALLYNQNTDCFFLKGQFEAIKQVDRVESIKQHNPYEFLMPKIDIEKIKQDIIQQGYKIEESFSEKVHNIYSAKSIKYYPDSSSDTQISEHLANICDEYLYEKITEDIQQQYGHILSSFIQIKRVYNTLIFQNGLEAFYKNHLKTPIDWKKSEHISMYINHQYVCTAYDKFLKKIKEKDNSLYDIFGKLKYIYNIHHQSGTQHFTRNKWQSFIKHLAILNFITQSYQGMGEEINSLIVLDSLQKLNLDKITLAGIKNLDISKSENILDGFIDSFDRIFTIDGADYEIPKIYFEKVKKLINILETLQGYYKDDVFYIKIEKNIDFILEIISLHKELTATVPIFINFNLNPSMSDGYQELFNLFAKLYMSINTPFSNKKPNAGDTILLLLDEPDNFLHPEWQKEFINLLVEFLNFNYQQYNFHIICTTHSPFILSDIPKENIIFLDNGKNVSKEVDINTFGSNIHTLLSHGFFMEDGLMGEFAKNKINEAIKILNKSRLSKEELVYCESIVFMIGEPLIKNQLQKIIDRHKQNYTSTDVHKEIELLKHRIESLRKQI